MWTDGPDFHGYKEETRKIPHEDIYHLSISIWRGRDSGQHNCEDRPKRSWIHLTNGRAQQIQLELFVTQIGRKEQGEQLSKDQDEDGLMDEDLKILADRPL